MGLIGAVRAARLLCIDNPQLAYWEERADELAAVALKLYYSPGEGDAPGSWEGRGDWLLWPLPLELPDRLAPYFSKDPGSDVAPFAADQFVVQALQDYAATAHNEVALAVRLQTEGAAYENKKTLSLARFWTGDRLLSPEQATENAEHIRILAADLPVPGTRHVGEVWSSEDDDGDGQADRADQRTGVPHLWSASLTYLSAMALSQPELFDQLEASYEPVCLDGEEPNLQRQVDCEGGCEGSLAGPGGKAPPPWLLTLVPVVALARRRRRR
jgi:hypothetical protein